MDEDFFGILHVVSIYKEIEQHNAHDIVKSRLINHKFSFVCGKIRNTGNYDGAAHDRQGYCIKQGGIRVGIEKKFNYAGDKKRG